MTDPTTAGAAPDPETGDDGAPSYAERLRISLQARATVVATEQQALHHDLDRLRSKASAGR